MLIKLIRNQEFTTNRGTITTDRVNVPIGFNVMIPPILINQLYNTGISSDILDKHIKNIMNNCDILLEKELKHSSLTGAKLKTGFSFGSEGMGVKINVFVSRALDDYNEELGLLTLSRDYNARLTLKEDKTTHVEKVKDKPRGRKRKL